MADVHRVLSRIGRSEPRAVLRRPVSNARWAKHRATTVEGLERSRKAGWKHGYYSAEAKAARAEARATVRALAALMPLSLNGPRSRKEGAGDSSTIRAAPAARKG